MDAKKAWKNGSPIQKPGFFKKPGFSNAVSGTNAPTLSKLPTTYSRHSRRHALGGRTHYYKRK